MVGIKYPAALPGPAGFEPTPSRDNPTGEGPGVCAGRFCWPLRRRFSVETLQHIEAMKTLVVPCVCLGVVHGGPCGAPALDLH